MAFRIGDSVPSLLGERTPLAPHHQRAAPETGSGPLPCREGVARRVLAYWPAEGKDAGWRSAGSGIAKPGRGMLSAFSARGGRGRVAQRSTILASTNRLQRAQMPWETGPRPRRNVLPHHAQIKVMPHMVGRGSRSAYQETPS